jgi:hypothetical protein
MPLELNNKQLLPEGLHIADLQELNRVFGRFQRSARRMQLVERLTEYVARLRQAGIGESLIVDGSFVMACVDEPRDIDLILVLPDNWDTTLDLNPYRYNLISRKRVKQEFPFDLFLVTSGSKEEAAWVQYFSQVNVKWYDICALPQDSTKGLVRILL